MDITFFNAGLAAGAALAVLPIILHLMRRQTPKKVIFPALRLLKERSKRTTKKLRIKHWLLLLARMLLIALMALALARPTWHTQTPLGDGDVPSALALVMDTSLSMEFVEKGRSRLDAGKEQAKNLLTQSAESSQCFVVDSAQPGVPPPLSPGAALQRIESLTTRSIGRPLNDAVSAALLAVSKSERPRKEIFVFTDAVRSAWDLNRGLTEDERALMKDRGIAVYVLRLGVKDPRDVAVTNLVTNAELVTAGEPVLITAKLRNTGPAMQRIAVLEVDGTRREQLPVSLQENSELDVEFRAPKLAEGLHQSRVFLEGGKDALAFNDERFLTFKVQPALRILVVSDLVIDAEFIANALDPTVRSPGDPRTYRVERRLTSQGPIPASDILAGYRAIIMNNVARLGDADWGRLYEYVRQGGGVVVGLGNRTNAESFNSPLAGQLLPASLKQISAPATPITFGKFDAGGHPLFDAYGPELNGDFSTVPVSRYWSVSPHPAARILLTFSDGAPTLLERSFEGARIGRVMLWTTPLSRRPLPDDPAAWNEFPAFTHWSFVYLMDRSIPFLAGLTAERFTYLAGETVQIRLPAEAKALSFTVKGPGPKPASRVDASGGLLQIVGPEEIGAWSATPVGAANSPKVNPNPNPNINANAAPATGTFLPTGFSINAPMRESELTPLEASDVENLMGKDRAALADNPEELKRVTTEQRVGREIFPWIMIIILMLVTMENFLANTFYRNASADAASKANSTPAHQQGAAP